MELSVKNNILSWGIDKKAPLVIGVSGGPDSLALLHILFVSGFNMIAVNVDHQLRDESGSEATFVKEFCSDRDIKFIGRSVNTLKLAKDKGLSIEEAARTLRYIELFKIANEVSAQAVCVAHNADDQIETILMHILRGTGIAGLRGIKAYKINPEWDLEIPVIRPLISVWRKEINSYCELNGLSPVQDLSNLDNKFLRNKIRNELLPYLVEYNPNIRNSLFQMSKIISADYEIIKKATDEAWIESVNSVSKDCVDFNREKLSKYPKALQNHLFRSAINLMRSGLRDISFNSIQIISNAIETKETGENIDLINNLSLTFNEDKVFIHDADHIFEIDHGLQLQAKIIQVYAEGEFLISLTWKMNIAFLPYSNQLMTKIKNNKDAFTAYVDANKIDDDLCIRKMSEGDRFSPLGMEGHTLKISDYFINQKVPRKERENWPILYSNHEIIWVVGYQINDEYQIDKETKKILKISVNKIEYEN